jgi:2,3-bisphosphoglycerate-dependent phosphoglycerate mutase
VLAAELVREPVAAIYSSPYPRARHTVEPLARRLSLEIETVDDLRERLLSEGPLPDWHVHVERVWSDFSCALLAGE